MFTGSLSLLPSLRLLLLATFVFIRRDPLLFKLQTEDGQVMVIIGLFSGCTLRPEALQAEMLLSETRTMGTMNADERLLVLCPRRVRR